MKQTAGAITLLFFLFFAFAATAQTHTVTLKLSSDGHPLIPVYVNGEGPYDFILDTAANRTTIYQRLAQEMSLEPKGPGANVTGASSSARYSTYDVNLISIDNFIGMRKRWIAAVPGGPSFAEDRGEIWGVLGSDIFDRLHVRFDIAGREVTFSTDPLDTRNMIPISIRETEHEQYFARIEVDSVMVDALIDTGANRSIINAELAAALSVSPDTEGNGNAVTRDAAGQRVDGMRMTVNNITLGSYAWQEQQIYYADLPAFDILFGPVARGFILGADLLDDMVFIMDYPGSTMWVPMNLLPQ